MRAGLIWAALAYSTLAVLSKQWYQQKTARNQIKQMSQLLKRFPEEATDSAMADQMAKKLLNQDPGKLIICALQAKDEDIHNKQSALQLVSQSH